MLPENAESLFEPFKQQHRNNRKYGGTGLGLWISCEMSRFMGGTLEVESTRGRGSVFTITIPIQKNTNFVSSLRSMGFEQRRTKTFIVADPVSSLIIKASLATIKQRAVILEDLTEVQSTIGMFKRSRNLIFLIKEEMAPPLLPIIEEHRQKVSFILLRQSEQFLDQDQEDLLSNSAANFE